MAEEGEIDIEESDEEVGEEQEEEAAEPAEEITPAKARMNKLFELRMKLNKARSLNKSALLDEFKRKEEGSGVDWKAKKAEWKDRKKKFEEDIEDETLNPDKDYLNTTAHGSDERQEKKRKKAAKTAAFGWEIFGSESMFNSYNKRVTKLMDTHGTELQGAYAARKAKEDTDTFFPKPDTLITAGASTSTDGRGKDRLQEEMLAQAESRSKWSRRRQFWEAADVDYINERNRVFNNKIKRAFDPYTAEIKQNLERGTAL